MKEIKKYWLIIVCAIIFVVSAIILFLRPMTQIEITNDTYVVNKKSPMAKCMEQRENSWYYGMKFDDENTSATMQTEIPTLSTTVSHLPYGVYWVRVEYASAGSERTPIAYIDYTAKENESGEKFLQGDEIELYNYKSWIDSPIWITSLKGADEITMNVHYQWEGSCEIYKIAIRENPLWKVLVLLCELVLFVLLNFIVYVFAKWDRSKRVKAYVLAILVFVACFPVLYAKGEVYWGHDAGFHMSRIASIANEIRYGHFPAFYQSDTSSGAGYLALIMYGNIFLYFPAILVLWTVPLTDAYCIYFIGMTMLTCGIAIYSFQRIFHSFWYGYLTTVLYVLSLYRLTNINIRGAVGEYSAMAFLPLVLYGFYRIYTAEKRVCLRETLPVIIGVTGVLQCHVLSIEMMVVFVGVYCLVHIRQTLKQLLPLILALISILLLNLFFLVPFLDFYKEPLTINMENGSIHIAASSAIIYQLFNMFAKANGQNSDYSAQGDFALCLGFPLVIGMFLFIGIMIYHKKICDSVEKKKVYGSALDCFTLGILALWMSSELFPWADLADQFNAVTKVITAVQFPWRYLSYAILFMSVITTYAIKTLGEYKEISVKNIGIKLSILVAAITFLLVGSYYKQFLSVNEPVRYYSLMANTANDCLYTPNGLNISTLYEFPYMCEPWAGVKIQRAGNNAGNDKLFYIEQTTEDAKVSIPVIYYKFLVAYDTQTNQRFVCSNGYNEQLTVEIPAGYTGTIGITYLVPKIWKVAYGVSFITFIGLIGVVIGNYYLNRKKGVIL